MYLVGGCKAEFGGRAVERGVDGGLAGDSKGDEQGYIRKGGCAFLFASRQGDKEQLLADAAS